MTPPKKSSLEPSAYSVTQSDGTPIPQPDLAPEKSIGKRIKEARLRPENDLTIEALSRLCKMLDPVGQGVSQQTIVRYEKGDVLPGSRELRILSDALDVSTDWLIKGQDRVGVVDMDVALTALAQLIKDRLTAQNPLAYPAKSRDVVRPMLLSKAKEPQPRK